MTSKKRKYGDLSARPLPTNNDDLLDEVFAAFTGTRQPVEETRLTPETSLVSETSLTPSIPDASHETSQPPPVSLTPDAPQSLGERAAGIAYGRGHTRIPHDFFDQILTELSAYEQLLYLHLLRYREGQSNVTVVISWPRLTKRTHLSQTTLFKAARSLEAKGIVRKLEMAIGRGKEQGLKFWVFSPTSLTPETSQTQKTRLTPRTNIKEERSKELLKGDSASPNFQNCPDCLGTGWADRGGGVARCKHEKLNV